MSATTLTVEAGIEARKTTRAGVVTKEEYCWQDKLHRPHEAGAAYICRNDASVVTYEAYYWEGWLHRLHQAGPAMIERNDVGVVTYESYWWEGWLHRPHEAGPARIRRNKVGQVTCEDFYWRNKLHRPPEAGPAKIMRDGDGKVTWEAYFWEGKRLKGRELHWGLRRCLLKVLLSAWFLGGGKPPVSSEGLLRFLTLRRVCRFHPNPSLKHRLVEPFGQAVVAFL